MTITEFLLARIAEDEDGHYPYDLRDHSPDQGDLGCVECGIMENRTCRTQRECAAKRAIIKAHRLSLPEHPEPDHVPFCGSCAILPLDSYEPAGAVDYPCLTVKALASIYSDHPDFQEEWSR